MRRLTKVALGGVGVVLVAAMAVGLASGCASVGYLAQSVQGHVGLMAQAKAVSSWTADPSTPDALRARLERSQRMRDFAVQALKLPDNRSYRRYADLGRQAAVWNVVAAPELSLTLKTWCFPVVGCVGYRGYYDEAEAKAYAANLQAAEPSLEVSVYPVPAYSTLGKLEWLGGDPLLNTFVNQPEAGLASLIFHELSHQVAFAPGDTAFNESFATAVERAGVTRWLAEHASADELARHARAEAMRQDFRDLVSRHRAALVALYANADAPEQKLARKATILAGMRAEHAHIKQTRWGGSAAYDAWFARANNATLAIMGSYNDWVPAFEALLGQQGGDFDRFYGEVRRLAALPEPERRAIMLSLTPAPSP